jgi:hypothetical protein
VVQKVVEFLIDDAYCQFPSWKLVVILVHLEDQEMVVLEVKVGP